MINRRSFMQLLAGLLIFRPKMRAEEHNYVVGFDPSSPDGDHGARSLGYTSMVSCRDCRFFSFRSIGGEKGKHFVTESACVRRGLPVSPKGLCMEYQAKGQKCPRCGIGRDTDGDGNCAFCGNLTDEEVRGMLHWREAKLKMLKTAKVCDGGRDISFPFAERT